MTKQNKQRFANMTPGEIYVIRTTFGEELFQYIDRLLGTVHANGTKIDGQLVGPHISNVIRLATPAEKKLFLLSNIN